MAGNSAERASRFSFANCCLVPSQMNLFFWALRRSRLRTSNLQGPPLAGAWYERPPLPRWRGNANMPGCHQHTAGLIPNRKIREYQCQKCRVDIVREPGQNLKEDQMERGPMGTGLFPIPRNYLLILSLLLCLPCLHNAWATFLLS